MSFSIEFFKAALANRKLEISSDFKTIEQFSVDTRTLEPGSLFVAIKGDQLDGHDYVDDAFAKGARAAIVRHGFMAADKSKTLLLVDDPLLALQDLAAHHLRLLPTKKIGLTGSNGKTTTKEMIRCALEANLGSEKVFANSGNRNNHIGLPLAALQVTKEHQVAIFEMGMNHFGEIARLAEIAKPEVGLITNMGNAHSGNLGGPEGVAKAKAELFEALPKNGVAVVNADDPRCVREAENKAPPKRISFGKSKWADVRLVESTERDDGLQITLSYQNQTQTVGLPLLGHHNALNASAAVATALALGLDFAKSVAGLAKMQAVKGRLKKHVLPNGAIVIDDTYNANPESMEAALRALSHFAGHRHVAIIGGMVELGAGSPDMHRAIGAACSQHGVNKLFACGENAQYYGEGAFEEGLAFDNFVYAKDSSALAEVVVQHVQPNDVILVKGSRRMQMEKVVEKLLCSILGCIPFIMSLAH